jgi:hypothetical protein
MTGPDAAARASLAAIIRHDLGAIRQMQASLEPLAAEAGYAACAGVAYALHNLYCAIENSFDQISRTFENHVVERDRWHRELMLKMFLEIPGVRPCVLPEVLRPWLNELRSFRHVFRHSYDFELDPQKLNHLVESWRQSGPALLEALSQFALWLTASSSNQGTATSAPGVSD